MGRFRFLLSRFVFATPALGFALGACGDDSAETSGTGAAGSASSTSVASSGPSSAASSGTGSGEGGDGPASTSSGDGGAGTGQGGEGSGGGQPCDDAAECDDGDVCTDDACDDGFCSHVAVADGTPIAEDGNPCTDDECIGGEETHAPRPAGSLPGAEGGCDGVCQAAPYDGQCGLSLYRKVYPGGDDTWTRDALSAIWTGDDAPPPDGILEAEQTFAQDRLLVWTEDGSFYQRFEGVWSGPTDIVDAFTSFPDGVTLAMTVAYQDTFGDPTETLSITTDEDEPRLLVYDLVDDGTIVLASGPDPIGNAQLGDPEAPPQHETAYDWGFARQTASPFQADDWIHFDESLGGRIYDLDGSSGGFDFIGSEAEADSALFAGDGGPTPGSVVAAYYDAESGQVFLVAP